MSLNVVKNKICEKVFYHLYELAAETSKNEPKMWKV